MKLNQNPKIKDITAV